MNIAKKPRSRPSSSSFERLDPILDSHYPTSSTSSSRPTSSSSTASASHASSHRQVRGTVKPHATPQNASTFRLTALPRTSSSASAHSTPSVPQTPASDTESSHPGAADWDDLDLALAERFALLDTASELMEDDGSPLDRDGTLLTARSTQLEWLDLETYMHDLRQNELIEFPEPQNAGSASSSAAAPQNEIRPLDPQIEAGLAKIRELDEVLAQLSQRSGASSVASTHVSTASSKASGVSTVSSIGSLRPLANEQYYFVYGRMSEQDEQRVDALMDSDEPEAHASAQVAEVLAELDENLRRFEDDPTRPTTAEWISPATPTTTTGTTESAALEDVNRRLQEIYMERAQPRLPAVPPLGL